MTTDVQTAPNETPQDIQEQFNENLTPQQNEEWVWLASHAPGW